MSAPPALRCFAVSAPGLAPFTALELAALGVADAQAEAGGVAFSGDRTTLYRANLHLRTANRVLVRLGEFEAVGFTELRRRAARLPWERYLRPGQAVALRVTCTKSRLYHSDAVAERVAGAIGDRLGRPPTLLPFDEEADPAQPAALPPQLVVVRLLHDQCTISVDSSGALLHRRGYRLAGAKAPLRETLAAGLLFASGWAAAAMGATGNAADPTGPAGAAPPPLIDPFCGSGTLPIEAALLACAAAPGAAVPGAERRFAFMAWPGFTPAAWDALLAAAAAQRQARTAAGGGQLHLSGGDRDAGAISAARDNAGRAGVAEQIDFACRAVSATEFPPTPGWIITNPPYGLRVGAAKDLRSLYAQLGKTLRARAPGWHFAVLSSDRNLLTQLGLPVTQRFSLVNGGVAVTLAVGQVA